jgi:prevent-host-death family protein
MTRHVTAVAARKNLGELLESVYYRGDEVIVERAGKPMGVIIPMSQYSKIERQRAEAIATMERIWANRPKLDPSEVEAAEQEILEETMAVRYGHR